MNSAELAVTAIPASLVLISGSGLLAVRSAVSRGYAVVVTGPSLRFEPPKPPRQDAAEAVPQPSDRGRSPYANDAWKNRPRAKGGQFASAGEKVPAPVQAVA